MAKRIKIKRYRRIYRRRRLSPWKAAGIAAALLAAVFVALSLYAPVRDFVTGKLALEFFEREASSSAPEPAPPPPAVPEPEPEPEPEIAGLDFLRAVRVPRDVLLAGGAVEYLARYPADGINAAVLDLKNERGEVLYQTNVALAHECGAVAEGALDLAAQAAALREAGYLVVGRVCAFRDPVAPRGAQRLGAVRYQNMDQIWLDDYYEEGGQPWLNPYAPVAQGYVSDLALEAVSLGADAILLDGLQFPEGVGRDLATYGEWAQGVERGAVLRAFAQELRGRLGERGGALLCMATAKNVLGEDAAELFGGESPAELFGEPLAVLVAPSQFGESYRFEDFALADAAASPYGTVLALLRRMGGGGIIPAAGGAETTLGSSGDTVAEQLRAVADAGIGRYIIW